MQRFLVLDLDLTMAAAAGRAIAAFLLINLMSGVALITDSRRVAALWREGSTVHGAFHLFSASGMAILAGAASLRQFRYAMRPTMTSGAVRSLNFTAEARLTMRASRIGFRLLRMAGFATAQAGRFQRF